VAGVPLFESKLDFSQGFGLWVLEEEERVCDGGI
jgi:hypothetical protein